MFLSADQYPIYFPLLCLYFSLGSKNFKNTPSTFDDWEVSASMAQDFAAELGSSFLNNSNWESVYTAQDRPLGIPPPAIPPSSNLQSVLWNSTMENFNYTFLRYSADVADPVFQAPNALDYYFRPNIFSYTVLCTYPISGQYGFPNRLLFYLLMIFALVVRKHSWLAAAALGTAMTYAASAAVHAFALLKWVIRPLISITHC